MNKVHGRGGSRRFFLFDSRILVGFVGLVLSIILHELFHLIVHWGYIAGIKIFPDTFTLVEILVSPTAPAYDMNREEMIAYSITLAVMLITAVVICLLHDVRDKRTVGEILFPKNEAMQLKALELAETNKV